MTTDEENEELKARVTELEHALINSRATFLGLQPDKMCPMKDQMNKAIRRINNALYNTEENTGCSI